MELFEVNRRGSLLKMSAFGLPSRLAVRTSPSADESGRQRPQPPNAQRSQRARENGIKSQTFRRLVLDAVFVLFNRLRLTVEA